MNQEKTLLTNHSNKDLISYIKHYAKQGELNPVIKEIAEAANTIRNSTERNKFVYEQVYNLAVFELSPNDRQQLRTVHNMIREQKANCTGYTTLIASILNILKQPYTIRLVDTTGNGYDHIYIISLGNVMDCVLGQQQNNNDSFSNRKINGMFDTQVDYKRKKDSNVLTIVNGGMLRASGKRINSSNSVNGFFDTFADLLGDECKRSCDLKYLSDPYARQDCKEDCARQATTGSYDFPNLSCPDRCESMYPNDLNAKQDCIRQCYGQPKDNTILYLGLGAAAIAAIYLLKKK